MVLRVTEFSERDKLQQKAWQEEGTDIKRQSFLQRAKEYQEEEDEVEEGWQSSKEKEAQNAQASHLGAVGACCVSSRGRRALRWFLTSHLPAAVKHSNSTELRDRK